MQYLKSILILSLIFCINYIHAKSQKIDGLYTYQSKDYLLESKQSQERQLRVDDRDIHLKIKAENELNEIELNTMKSTIKNDFLVNDDTTGSCSHYNPAVAMDASGNFVIAWKDERNYNSDIYAQRYNSSGNVRSVNFRVNDDYGVSWQSYPTIAMDNKGSFVIAWRDFRNGNSDIYVAMYDSSGTALGANFIVNDDEEISAQYNPHIAINDNGDFIIVWEDGRNGNFDIYAQRYNSSGIAIGSNFKINDDSGSKWQSCPSVAMYSSGNFVIVWEDERNEDSDIYGQRYNSDGNKQGLNFRVNNDTGIYEQNNPSVAMDESGNFIIAWHDERNGNYDIYAQRYNTSGNTQNSNFKVNEDSDLNNQYYPSVSIDHDGNFVIVWQDYRNDNYDIYAQKYSSTGNTYGKNFKVNDDKETKAQVNPSISMNKSGNFIITWGDKRDNHSDIYTQRYNSSCETQGVNFRVNDDIASSSQYNPAIAKDIDGNFVIVWEDKRNGNYDIYAQIYNSSGVTKGLNFKVNDDNSSVCQRHPSLAFDNYGNFVIVWEDDRNIFSDIYAQRYNSSGNTQGINFRVNDDSGISIQKNPSVTMDADGSFVIVWEDGRNNNSDVYAQRYNQYGEALGENFIVNNNGSASFQHHPSIAMNHNGDFIITWEDERHGTSDIYAQRYNSSGIPKGSDIRVNDDAAGTFKHYFPSPAIDNSGDFVIVWEDYRNHEDYPDIYIQILNSNGSKIGSNIRVNDDLDTNIQNYPSIAINPDGERFVVVWTDYRNSDGDPEILAQEYNDGNPMGNNIQINNDKLPYYNQCSWKFSIDCNSNRIGFVWMDNRRNKGWDIYCKITDWGLTGIKINNDNQTSNKKLKAYPNPFYKSVTVSSLNIDFKIYDLSGRLVGLGKNGAWNGKDLNGKDAQSGVYFIKANGFYPLKVIKLK